MITPAQAEQLRTALQAVADALTLFADHLRAAGLLDKDGHPTRRPDRPAWQSPYGPPPRRHR
ncbi:MULTISPECIES: hypothetical protein [unclassified Streptomyces]|uniref:hypothetical protein n=1 Tax=unclassified Streptomyces TaxID=2593676 RepID=UPI0035E23B32